MSEAAVCEAAIAICTAWICLGDCKTAVGKEGTAHYSDTCYNSNAQQHTIKQAIQSVITVTKRCQPAWPGACMAAVTVPSGLGRASVTSPGTPDWVKNTTGI